jgi:prepilin-type N-terminal cleavage/methylation domain-containing protein/prepilin-type processing-associated H-X9-DG protein
MSRRGFSLVELVAAVSIIGLLILMLIPAVLASRELGRQVQCQNNLKQVSLALLNYHSTFDAFPPGYSAQLNESGRPIGRGWSWSVMLLPYMEQGSIYSAITTTSSLSAPENLTLRSCIVRTFICPSDPLPSGQALIEITIPGAKAPIKTSPSSYIACFGTGDPLDYEKAASGNGMFIRDRAIRLEEMLDGTSTTFLVGERTQAAGPTSWVGVLGQDGAALILGSTGNDNGPNAKPVRRTGFSSNHPEGAHFAYGDGSVRFLKSGIGNATYRALATRRGGEIVEGDQVD